MQSGINCYQLKAHCDLWQQWKEQQQQWLLAKQYMEETTAALDLKQKISWLVKDIISAIPWYRIRLHTTADKVESITHTICSDKDFATNQLI